jgi:hypothetical protein
VIGGWDYDAVMFMNRKQVLKFHKEEASVEVAQISE